MLRLSTFSRLMTRLALLAVLLMAFAPSVSRLIANAGGQVISGWSELCTSAGLKWVDTADTASAMKKAPASGEHAKDGDCDYCRLADGMAVLLLALVLGVPVLAVRMPSWRPIPWSRMVPNARGLGSQGPPILL